MNKFMSILLAVITLSMPALAAESDAQIKLISYNLRNSGAGDGSNSWENRRAAAVAMIEREAPDVFGVQEALADQLLYLDEQCSAYARVGVGRDDGDKAGETMAIYYSRDRFNLLNGGTLWLSETPDQVSRGWDGACNRTMTWVELQDKATGKRLFYFNTHLDHQGKVAREEGIKLMVEKIREIAKSKTPVVLGGDFNSSTENGIFKPLQKYMSDARVKAPQTSYDGTFNGFGSAPDTILIDHLFYRGAIKCQRFATLKDNYGVPYISDHYPIEMVFTLK